ncbi:MAG: carbon-nitrogen hydrolase family protein [Gammaproteobacteria bacterium]|nr:carbon-nitrogen hydrolase family protein [Gammaproteobacteria bacterium]
MSNALRIGLLQLNSFGFDQEKNLQKGLAFCKKAKEMGADIVLFPEMWNIGYTFYKSLRGQAAWKKQAVERDSEFIRQYIKVAKEWNFAIAITYLEKYKKAFRNAVVLIDRQGKIVLHYAKVHTCDFAMESVCMPGDDFYVCDLDTEKGLVKIGAMICFDREFPEAARILMLKGAEIILVPNACSLEQNRMAQINSRAFENMVGIAVANYAAPQMDGNSTAFDGIAFDEKGISRDMMITKAGQVEGVYLADFDLKKLRDYRKREVWGNAYRKPKTYQLLTSKKVLDPFIRKDAKR